MGMDVLLFLTTELEAIAEALVGANARAGWRGADPSALYKLLDVFEEEAARTGYRVGEIAGLLGIHRATVRNRLPGHVSLSDRGQAARIPPDCALWSGLTGWTMASHACDLPVPDGSAARPVRLGTAQAALIAPYLRGLAAERGDEHLHRVADWLGALDTEETLPLGPFLGHYNCSHLREGGFWRTKVRTGAVELTGNDGKERVHLKTARIYVRDALILWRNTWAAVCNGPGVMPGHTEFLSRITRGLTYGPDTRPDIRA